MHMKTKWLKRLTAAVLSIGMAFAPAVAESGLTYADMKAPERNSRIMVASGSEATPGDATPSNVSVNFTEESKTVTFGDEFTVRVVTSPANAEVKWEYENEDVIVFADPAENSDPQVSRGEMTYKAVGAGSSEIYVKINDPTYENMESAEDVLKVIVNKLKLELETSSLSLEVSKQQKLPLTTNVPAGTILNWSSDKESVATVDQSGNVTAVAEGTATITVSADHCEPAACTVTITKADDGQKEEMAITLDKKDLRLEVGSSDTLKAVVTPANATVNWRSENPDIADVKDGTVTAVAAGKTTVIASIDTDVEAKCIVTVTEKTPEPAITELKLKVTELLLTKGGKGTLEVTNAPENTELKWASENEKVATVDKGVVTAVAAGETKIIVSGENCTEATAVVTVTKETGAVLEGNSEVTVSVDKNAVEVSRENLPDSVTDKQLADAKNAAVDAALNSVKNNKAVLEPAEGLKEAVKVKLKEGEKGVSRVDSELKNMEMIAEMVNGKLVVRPSRLVYDASVAMDIFDENGNLVTPDKHVLNTELAGTITFRLAIPKTVTETYAQVVHRSADYNDSNIRNLVIQNKGTDNAYISVEVRHFSEFDITFTNSKVSTGSSGGSSGGSSRGSYKAAVQGTWMKDATGWWYKYPNHTWPANCWIQLEWNGTSQWYRFNEAGYMVAGWYLDTDGNWYFLHNVSDGAQGHMYTGWHQIEGKWYYFRENAGGPVGSLVVNGTTPDGYTVDANGVWVQ